MTIVNSKLSGDLPRGLKSFSSAFLRLYYIYFHMTVAGKLSVISIVLRPGRGDCSPILAMRLRSGDDGHQMNVKQTRGME